MKSELRQSENLTGVMYGLSGSEVKVLELLVKGLRRKEISEHLSVSVHTVNTHFEKIYEKLAVHNEAAAVAKLIGEQLLPYKPIGGR